MKKIALFFYLLIKKICRNIKWTLCIGSERKKVKRCEAIQKLPHGKKMILIPHADDEWIGCSGIITKNEDEVLLCNMDMQGNDSTALHELRYRELESIAKKYSRKMVTVKESKADSLKKYIADEAPEYIAVPFFVDWHEEHAEVIKILYDVINDMGNTVDFRIIAYQVSVPICIPCATHCINFDKQELKEKWNVFQLIYKTQKRGLPFLRFKAHERINGAYSGSYACEVYAIFTIERWMNLFEHSFCTDDREKKDLYSDLNNIPLIREKSAEMCKKLLKE